MIIHRQHHHHRHQLGLSYKFVKKMIQPDSCIHHLIPEKRDESILARLRNPSQYSQ